MRANQANIRANSAEIYSAFVEALLAWGRCQSGQEQEPEIHHALPPIKSPTLVTSDNDQLIPKELSELIAAKFQHASSSSCPAPATSRSWSSRRRLSASLRFSRCAATISPAILAVAARPV